MDIYGIVWWWTDGEREMETPKSLFLVKKIAGSGDQPPERIYLKDDRKANQLLLEPCRSFMILLKISPFINNKFDKKRDFHKWFCHISQNDLGRVLHYITMHGFCTGVLPLAIGSNQIVPNY